MSPFLIPPRSAAVPGATSAATIAPLIDRQSTPSSTSDHVARWRTFSTARHSNAPTTTMVEVDRSQTVRYQGRVMRTSCIQQSLANRIPRMGPGHRLELVVFAAIYITNDHEIAARFQNFGRVFRSLGGGSFRWI